MNISLTGALVFSNTREGVIHMIKFTPVPTLAQEVLARVAEHLPSTNVVAKSDEPFQAGSAFVLQTSDTSAERPFVGRKGKPQAGTKHLTFRNLPANRLCVLMITEGDKGSLARYDHTGGR